MARRLKFRRLPRMVPDLPQGALSSPPPLGPVESPSESARYSDVDMPTANVQAPKCSGGELGALPPQRIRTESREARITGRDAFRERHQVATWDRVGTPAMHRGAGQIAVCSPAAGRPARNIIFPTGSRLDGWTIIFPMQRI